MSAGIGCQSCSHSMVRYYTQGLPCLYLVCFIPLRVVWQEYSFLYYYQERQCNCKRNIRKTTVAVESNKRGREHAYACVRPYVCVCVCVNGWVGVTTREQACASLLIQYATRRRHILCILSGCNIFLHYLINGTIFGEKFNGHKFCLKHFCF